MNNRDKVFIHLSEGKDVNEIAQLLDIGYSTVVRYKGEYKQAEEEGKLDLILSQDSIVIEQIANELKGDATNVVKGLKGLEKLSENMQISAELILVKLKTIVSNVGPDDVSDLAMAADVLCKLQNSFFNKNSVNVNVQNNNFDSGEATYGEFLSDKPPINI